MQHNSRGFSVVEGLIILAVLAVIGFVGYTVFTKMKSDSKQQTPGTSTGDVRWQYNEQSSAWETVSGTAPECKEPFVFDNSPVDLSQVTSIMMPGQYRGFNYKPHGGFRADASTDGQLEVRMPMDAMLVGLTRYYEGDPAELQYLLTFESDCGIAFRFDHLYTLAPEFQTIAETTPEPKLNDTRTDPNAPFARTAFKAGDVIATAIGFPTTKNFGFDFGVYDYRQPNEISKNTAWAAIHNQFTATEWYGACWLGMLPGADAAKAKELSEVVVNPQRPNIISDYCANAQYQTLDFNNGQPTDG